jgi:hypothetical protein
MFGATMPDGGLLLSRDEAVWLRRLFDRVQVARHRMTVDAERYRDVAAYRDHVDRHVREALSTLAANAEACTTGRPADPDEAAKLADRGQVLVQCELVVLSGGLPPLPGRLGQLPTTTDEDVAMLKARAKFTTD